MTQALLTPRPEARRLSKHGPAASRARAPGSLLPPSLVPVSPSMSDGPSGQGLTQRGKCGMWAGVGMFEMG